MSRKASSPGAASTPAWRMPPPSRLRARRASAITSSFPASSEPTGAQRPFDRQHMTVVAGAAHSAAGDAGGRLGIEEPGPVHVDGHGSGGVDQRAAGRSSDHGAPDAAMCVFSMLTSDTSG